MKISVITPNFNGEAYIQECLASIVNQATDELEIELIVMDGGSTDRSAEIIRSFGDAVSCFVSEKDDGPCDAINKGFARATGDLVAWLNADDVYVEGALARVAAIMQDQPTKALCFGHCPIIDENGQEIRQGITRFKEMFYPMSCRFVIQSINYVSQPAMVFRHSALDVAGPLRMDLKAAWDYEFILRLWRQGGAVRVPRPALAKFRWHPGSISGQHFKLQFKEEYEAAVADAGTISFQAILHWFVRWGIVGSYSLMASRRKNASV